MIKAVCPKHENGFGDPKCEDCWKHLFYALSHHNVNLAMDEDTKDLIDKAR